MEVETVGYSECIELSNRLYSAIEYREADILSSIVASDNEEKYNQELRLLDETLEVIDELQCNLRALKRIEKEVE